MAVGKAAEQLEHEQSYVVVVEPARMPFHVLRQVSVLRNDKLSMTISKTEHYKTVKENLCNVS